MCGFLKVNLGFVWRGGTELSDGYRLARYIREAFVRQYSKTESELPKCRRSSLGFLMRHISDDGGLRLRTVIGFAAGMTADA